MKAWRGYGSEHSMNLVMIGRFKDVRDAEMAKELIDRLTDEVAKDSEYYLGNAHPADQRFSDSVLQVLQSTNFNTLHPTELEQFGYNVHVQTKDSDVVVTTDESDVSAFLKVLIEKGARVEVYSGHDYPDPSEQRGAPTA